jgi:hypothetical protein
VRVDAATTPAKRDTVGSPATRDETYGKGAVREFRPWRGPNVRRINPVGVGRPCGLCYPQVKTCGYSRLAPSGAYRHPIN